MRSLIFAVLFLIAAPASAKDPIPRAPLPPVERVDIAIVIVDKNDKPQPGVSVDVGGGRHKASGTTDGMGRIRFPGAPRGPHWLVVRRGYRVLHEGVVSADGQVQRVRVR